VRGVTDGLNIVKLLAVSGTPISDRTTTAAAAATAVVTIVVVDYYTHTHNTSNAGSRQHTNFPAQRVSVEPPCDIAVR
jgi:hypothetical protein